MTKRSSCQRPTPTRNGSVPVPVPRPVVSVSMSTNGRLGSTGSGSEARPSSSRAMATRDSTTTMGRCVVSTTVPPTSIARRSARSARGSAMVGRRSSEASRTCASRSRSRRERRSRPAPMGSMPGRLGGVHASSSVTLRPPPAVRYRRSARRRQGGGATAWPARARRADSPRAGRHRQGSRPCSRSR